MRADLKELWRFRELLWAMVERELRIRYKNSVLGFFWSLINPLVTVAVMTLVFGIFLNNQTPNYSAFVLSAYLPFMFINLAILDAAQSVLVSLQVVKKVYFPREILPLAAVISNFIHLLLAFLVFFAYLFCVWAFTGFQVSPFTWKIGFLPILLVVTLCFTTGIALIISALNVFYEDIKYAVSVLLYLIFFLTPIMYFSENVWVGLRSRFGSELGAWLYQVYHLNPMASLATAYKKSLVPNGPIKLGGDQSVAMFAFDWSGFWVSSALSVALLIFGYWVFNRMKWRFVERP